MKDKSISFAPWLTDTLESLTVAYEMQRLGHALLISGAQGVGKLALGRALAGRLLGLGEATGDARRQHPDFHLVQPAEGKQTLTVDQIRDVCGKLALTSHSGGAKVALLVPAEAMTLAAANALLKTLEEPASNTYLILVSHVPGGLPATIRSRCQTHLVARPVTAQAVAWLRAQRDLSSAAGDALISFANGAPYLALRLFDEEFLKINKELKNEFKKISSGEADPIAVAERWSRADPGVCLDWLAREVRGLIRNLVRGNEVTDWVSPTLHNMPAPERLQALITRVDQIDTARRLLGGGVNTEMMLRTLLLEFAPTAIGKSYQSE